jgi:hypothetical protein
MNPTRPPVPQTDALTGLRYAPPGQVACSVGQVFAFLMEKTPNRPWEIEGDDGMRLDRRALTGLCETAEPSWRAGPRCIDDYRIRLTREARPPEHISN